MIATVETNSNPKQANQPSVQVLKVIKEILEEYANNPDELSSERYAVEIFNLILKGRWCSYRPVMFCQELECCGCPIWAKESGYLAYALSQP